jgi:hypothetical protein
MITLSLLIAACFTLVSPQLALAQHTALMDLYDTMGLGKNGFFLSFFHFLSFFLSFSISPQVALLHCARALRRRYRVLVL